MSKSKMRTRLASLSFSEKIKILEKLPDRSKAIAASGLRHKAEQASRKAPKQAPSNRKRFSITRLQNYQITNWSSHANPLGQIHRQSAGSRPARERTRLRAWQSELQPLHLLAALLEDREGIVPPVLEKIGIGPQVVLAEVYKELEKLPKVSGSAAQATLSNEVNKLIEQALKEASNFKDEYVSTEHLLLAITHLKRDVAQQILAAHGATYDAILKALTVVRGSQKSY